MHEEWAKRKGTFNHDWLKNRYLMALRKWMNMMDGVVLDPGFDDVFIKDVLPTWEGHTAEAASLIADFEAEMSPRVLFSREPLSGCDEQTKEWLPDLTHALWKARFPVDRWVADANVALAAAEEAYHRLSLAIKGQAGRTLKDLAPCRAEFAAFTDGCQKLSSAISAFPSEIQVT